MAKKRTTRDTEATVRLSRLRGSKGPIRPRVFKESEGPVSLEEMLTAFQKSLGRANRSSLEASRSEAEFLLGIRALYVIEGLNVTLRVGIRAASLEGSKDKRVIVDFDAPEKERSEVQFRVQTKPLEATKASELLLADGDPLGTERPRFQLIATLIGVPSPAEPEARRDASALQPRPLKDQAVHFHIVGGKSATIDTVTLRTNEVGQAGLTIDAGHNRVESSRFRGDLKNVDLILQNDDFFVFVTSEDPRLESNVLHFSIDRSKGPKPSKKRKGDEAQ
jgi:hypothetical protein